MGDNTNSPEEQGHAFMQRRCAEELAVWQRFTAENRELDGLIEMERRDGASLYVGAQVRSGSSYFRDSWGGRIALNLEGRLKALNNLGVPCIVVAYDPERNQGYWRSVRTWCADHPESLASGRIEIELTSVLDPAAFHAIRADARVVLAPKLGREEIREFLEINRELDHVAFVVLAHHVLGRTEVRARGDSSPILSLAAQGLLASRGEFSGSTRSWRPTLKGERYIQFMLGDRYFLPFQLIQPQNPITDEDVELCMDFEGFLGQRAIPG